MKKINVILFAFLVVFGISCKGPDASEIANEVCDCYESIIGPDLFTQEDAEYHVDSCEKLMVFKYDLEENDELRNEVALFERQIDQSKAKVKEAYYKQIENVTERICDVYHDVLDRNPYIKNALYLNLSDSIDELVRNWYGKDLSHEVISKSFSSESVSLLKAEFINRYKMQPTDFISMLNLMDEMGDFLYSPNDERVLFHMYINSADYHAKDVVGYAVTSINGQYIIGIDKNQFNIGRYTQTDAEYSILCHDFGGNIDYSELTSEVLVLGTFKKIEQQNWGKINIAHMENCELIGVYYNQEISMGKVEPWDEYYKYIGFDETNPDNSKISNTDQKVANDKNESDSNGSRECDEFLDGYEEFMEDYVELLKKYKDNPTDMSLLTDYTKMMTEVSEWASKKPNCSDEEFLRRYAEIQTKIANAASDL